ncbi:DUF1440 domain-containing protein [Cribrihabitans neustonicus]|uniref:DUF1440 domain-containing protein n=1 Tax=Cribrihabitans neustonicus TaxID=1429085 RepID=UPI003B59CADD
MKTSDLVVDIGVGLLADFVATKVTERGQTALWKVTPEHIQRQENCVRPGPPLRVAAEKTTELLGFELDEDSTRVAGMALHYASGVGWGQVNCVMRRAAGMNSLGAGVAAGASMSLLLDEIVTPALGFSAPNRTYPAATHIRGLLGHLVYGLALAGTAEAVYRLIEPRTARRNN